MGRAPCKFAKEGGGRSLSVLQSFLFQICLVFEAVLLKTPHFAPGWASIIRINFESIRDEIGPKVGDVCSLKTGSFFVRLQ